jgi:HlyD family secretion protein
MKSNVVKKNKNSRKIWVSLVMIVLIAAGAAGYFYWNNQKNVVTAQASTSTVNTSTVKKGDIAISVSGSGTLTAGQEKALAFPIAGTVKAVNVQVGDQVEQGQELAELDGQDELKANVNSAQQDLITAQKELQTLNDNASSNIANAQLDLATAQKAVIDAKNGLIQPGQVPCDSKTTESYYYKYTKAKEALDALGDGGGSYSYYLSTILPAKNTVSSAYSQYESCIKFTDYTISSSQATLSLEQAKLKLAQEKLDTLTKNNGIDPVDLASAENKVASTQLALDQAQQKLDQAVLKAPIDGIVLSISANAGDSVDTSTFITIADLNHPKVEFSIDETDMDKAAVGESATVTFDAIPDTTFTGNVTRIDPFLSTSGSYSVVTGVIALDLSKTENAPTLRKGLNATVELVQASAKDALLVPVQAVRDLGDGKYGVFVVDNGKTKLAFVEVGLMDAASAEIKSGLTLGQTVSTGETQTK